MSTSENFMNLWRKMKIDNYLYEIIDDYKSTDSAEERENIFESFCSSIWTSDNKRRIYTKTIRFTVKKELADTEIGQIFETWSEIEYMGYQSMSKKTDWCSLIRQKINNLYTRYFDKEVILNRDYINLLNIPKRLHYDYIHGIEMNPDELTDTIDNAIDTAGRLKIKYQNQKMTLTWDDYIQIINGFLLRIFNNCKYIEDYEIKAQLNSIYDFFNEDNFYIKYFCKSLEMYMQNYTKEYYGLKRGRNIKYARCKICGHLIEKTHNRKIYCDTCSKKQRLKSYKKYNKKRCNHN